MKKIPFEKLRITKFENLSSIKGGSGDDGGTQTNTARPKSTGNPICRPDGGDPPPPPPTGAKPTQ